MAGLIFVMVSRLEAASGKPVTPTWCRSVLRQFVDDYDRLKETIAVARSGIAMVNATPKLMRALSKVEGDDAPGAESLNYAERMARRAEQERQEDFAELHAWAVVAVWAQIEGLVKHLSILWLKNRRSAWRSARVADLKIRLGEYLGTPARDRAEWLLDALERQKEPGAGVRSSIEKLEARLAWLGLELPPLPIPIRRKLFEMGHVRNVIVHSGSKVDPNLMKACPWLKSPRGSRLKVGTEAMAQYFAAVGSYAMLIVCRCARTYGVDVTEFINGIERDAERIEEADKRLRSAPRSQTRRKRANRQSP